MALFDQPSMIGPNTKPEVDPANETVEGRVGGLLQTDGQGNYTNQVVRQAVDRQDQSFNARGLRNSSLAVQGGTEAAISKAVDIATPDARTYYDNRRSNISLEGDFTKQKDNQAFDMSKQHDTQAFTTRQDYQKAVQTIGTNYQRQIDTINASQMTPADKNVAIQQAAAVRDGEMAFQNNLYSRTPQWQQEWLAPSIPTGGMDMASVTNADTLSTIVNDPAQPQAMRDAAAARLTALGAGGGGTPGSSMIGGPGPGGVAGTASNGQPLPSTVSTALGAQVNVNWDSGSPTLRSQYEAYAHQMGGAALPPSEWYRLAGPGAWTGGGGFNPSDGGGGDGGGGAGAGSSGGASGGSAGDSGGVSI